MEREEKIKSKRGQVTIFIIMGIIIVVGIILVFIFQNELGISTKFGTNPTKYIEKCALDNAKIALENIESHGGIYYTTNEQDFISFNGEKIAKLCYSNDKKILCTNNHPLFNEEIERKIKSFVEPKLVNCFSDLKSGYSIEEYSEEPLLFNVSIIDQNLILNIRKVITISDGAEKTRLNNFDVSLSSSLFDFLEITNSVLNDELSCDCSLGNCNADIGKINVWYPQYVTDRFMTEKSEKIYTIQSLASENKFVFAVRNCARV